MEKILIFTTRQMCYDSAGFFAKKLAVNLEELGVECELCMFAEEEIGSRPTLFAQPLSASDGLQIQPHAEELLSHYVGKNYLAVIDFNSKLPRIAMEDGSLFLDNINAPFINYILDHPLYHHSMLASPLKRYHVITPDENHAAYVREYYPNVKSVRMLPLGASEVRSVPEWEEKDPRVLFIGTYHDPQTYYDQILQMPQEKGLPGKEDVLRMIGYMEADSSVTVEAALKKLFMESYGLDPSENKEQLRLWLNRCYLAEIYLRNVARKQAVEALLRADVPVKTIGDWWERFPLAQNANLRMEEGVAFSKSYRCIAQSQVLLNSSPFFYGGMHDRIPAAMANSTLLLTDDNPYLREQLPDGDCMYRYTPGGQYRTLVDMAKKALLDADTSKKYVKRAHELYQMRYTWLQTAQNMLKYIASFSDK